MSTTLFNVVNDWILRNALTGVAGVQVGSKLALTSLMFADGISILGDIY